MGSNSSETHHLIVYIIIIAYTISHQKAEPHLEYGAEFSKTKLAGEIENRYRVEW